MITLLSNLKKLLSMLSPSHYLGLYTYTPLSQLFLSLLQALNVCFGKIKLPKGLKKKSVIVHLHFMHNVFYYCYLTILICGYHSFCYAIVNNIQHVGTAHASQFLI